jgi:hypothetical protein
MNQRFYTGVIALLSGMLLNHLGDRLLGVQLELFSGLSTFSFAWGLDLFFVPFLVGLLVARIFGSGAKWLCYFPPLIVRCLSYANILYITGIPHGSILNPMGWWGLYVILAIESSAMGGILGEVMIKKVYGRSPKADPVLTVQPVIEQPVLEKD